MTGARRVWRAALAMVLGLVVVAAVGGGGGFLWFVRVAEAPQQVPPHADGIVVLTGGAERVETGLHLLAEGQARLLLVSGVARGTELSDLARLAGLEPGPMAARVELGRTASTTRGNALETEEWARRMGIRSLIVVTAGYHMPRALAELSAALPAVTLYPVAVQPPALRRGNGLTTLRLLAAEYVKFLASWAGLSPLAPPGGARSALSGERLSAGGVAGGAMVRG